MIVVAASRLIIITGQWSIIGHSQEEEISFSDHLVSWLLDNYLIVDAFSLYTPLFNDNNLTHRDPSQSEL